MFYFFRRKYFFFKRLTAQGKICYNMVVNESGYNMRIAMR